MAQVAPPLGAFRGDIIGTPANVSQVRVDDLTETITISASKARIDWSASQADFLPSANTATFLGSGVTDFTVLNVINADGQQIELNGTVLGRLQGQGSTPGGKIWFYSPGGILVGSTAVFDVGGLVLTANDPVGFADSTDGFGQFNADLQSNALVSISPGATINATAENSYVALIAPRVHQLGTVNVNGSAAYVAGQQLTMTINQGLFDVAVQVGTDDPNGVVHTGTTGGSASTGAGDNHRITMVAVPKNTALTMLLSGNVGFAPATQVGVENGTIVLSAGWSVDDTPTGFGGVAVGSNEAGIDIGAGNFTSDVDGLARGDILASSANGSLAFSGDLRLRSYSGSSTSNIYVEGANEQTLSVGGNLFLANGNTTYPSTIEISAYNYGAVDIVGDATLNAGSAGPADPGAINLLAFQNGSLTIGGNTVLNTSAAAASINPDTASTDNYAGDVEVSAGSGGSIAVGDLTIHASANGQDNNGNGSGADLGAAGDAHGGDVSIDAQWDGTITIDGNLFANVDGYGGNIMGSGLLGGSGLGGSAAVNGSNGGLTITGNLFLTALGIGGDYVGGGTPTVAQGGFGQGGWANVVLGGPGSISISGSTTLRADGLGGDARVGGEGRGGIAGITAYDGEINLGSLVNISARGTGGNANVGFGGAGGLGQGGAALIEAFASPGDIEQDPTASTITAPVLGNVILDVTGSGGFGGAGNGDNIAAGTGGAGHGGLYTGPNGKWGAFVLADSFGATLTIGALNMYAAGLGGAGGIGGTDQQGGLGGTGTGGFTQAGTFNPNQLSFADAVVTIGNVYMDSGAIGGAGGAGDNDSVAGASALDGVGGYASAGGNTPCGEGWFCGGSVVNTRGSVTTGILTMASVATGGSGSVGGGALGGVISVNSIVGGSLQVGGALNINTSGNGGAGVTIGGNATGGNSSINSDSTIAVTNGIILAATGHGGTGNTGGDGAGGESLINVNFGATLTAGGLVNYNTAGRGGNGIALGGNGAGGDSLMTIDGGSITVGTLFQYANGFGGTGATGGNAVGGIAATSFSENGGSFFATGNARMEGQGLGGAGTSGSGGTGTGGENDLALTTGASFTANRLINFADGIGGDSSAGAGGSGTGGVSTLTIDGGSLVATLQSFVTADGFGGAGASGGDGLGGIATVEMTSSGGSLTSGYLETHSWGHGGDSSGVGPAGSGTGNFTSFEVADLLNDGATATISLGRLLALSDGDGGNVVGTGEGAGGDGTGGNVIVDFGTATTTITQLAEVRSRGTGGNGVSSGGQGDGGSAQLIVRGGPMTALDVEINADGFGGHATNGAGGNAVAGQASISVTGTLTATGETWVSADGEGGDGTTSGNGDGGTSTLSVFGGGSADLALANVRAAGTGGEGPGGTGTGGYASVDIENGSLTADEMFFDVSGETTGGTAAIDVGYANDGITVGALTTDVLTASANGTQGAGKVLFNVAYGSSANLGAATLSAIGANPESGGISLFVGSGFPFGDGPIGGLFADSLALTSSGPIYIELANGAAFDVDGAFTATSNDAIDIVDAAIEGPGDLSVGDTLSLTAGTTISAGNLDAGGDLMVDADGNISVGNLTAAGEVNLRGGGNLVFADASGAEVKFDAVGTVTGNNITATTRVDGHADGALLLGDITAGPNLPEVGDFSVGISSATSITVGNVSGAGQVGFATPGSLTTGNLTAGSLVMTMVGGNTSTGAITTNAGGQVYMADWSMFELGGGLDDDFNENLVLPSFPVSTGGSILIDGPVTTGMLRAAAGTDLWIGDVTAGQVASVLAGGTANFVGTVSAPVIYVTSRDIYIAEEASLGDRGVTELLTLNAVSIDPIIIGEWDQVSEGVQYRLDEDGDIEAATVVINAVAMGDSAAPDIHIYDVEIEGSLTNEGDDGGVSLVEVNTGGSVVVNGLLLYSGAAASDVLDINAGETIQVNTSNGGRIAMIANSEEPSGILELSADNIWVGDQALLDNLSEDPDFAERDAALATNNGQEVPEGHLIAGGMSLGVSNTLFVQNTGTETEFAGITVGDTGLEIRSIGEDPATVIGYGARFNGDGTFTGGEEFAALIDFGFDEGPGYTELSAFNGCSLGTSCAPDAGPGGPIGGPESILGPVGLMDGPMGDNFGGPAEGGDGGNEEEDDEDDAEAADVVTGGEDAPGSDSDDSEEDEEEDEEESAASVAASLGLISTGGLTTEQLIDDPVTSGSDSGQWGGDPDGNPQE